MSSSEDDDIPLSALASKRGILEDESSSSEGEAEFVDNDNYDDSADDDDEEFVDSDIDDSDDEDDDTPISALKSVSSPGTTKNGNKKRKATVSSCKPDKKKQKKKVKPASIKKKKKKKKPSESSSNNKSNNNSLITVSSELYSKAIKGKLIQHLLCRWWYAIKWPEPSTLPESPPPNCDALDGFPGVYVHTSGAEVGKIIDYRDKASCPNFKNMASKSSQELKDLLLKAIELQKGKLIEVEGKATKTEKDLCALEKWVRKINVDKADKESKKVLKAAGFSV